MSAMVPALRDAKARAPKADPPYRYGDKTVDPYPKKTYLGRRVAPGFASRNVVRVSRLNKDRTSVRVSLGVRAEAFYAVQFIELGTSRIFKRPWLEPSFRASLPLVDEAFQATLKKRIDRAAKT